MNDEMKLRLAYAEIARLKDEMATANRGQVDLIAHDQALRADFERQREEDRQFFKAQQDNMKEFYMQQMKEQAERHKEELKHLREENLENVKRIMKDSANHQKASDNLIASLNEKITKLTSMLEKSSLSASEAQWLARYRQRQRFKRNAEQKNLLKSGKEVTKEEEKSDWPEDSNDDVPSTPSSASGDGIEYERENLGSLVHKIISYIRKEMKDVWEATIKKTHNLMIDEASGLVGVKTDEGVRKYLKRYFWGIKANVQKLVWFIYEHGSRGLKAIRQFLDNFIGFFTTDAYVVYKVYDDDELHPDQHRSACLTHIRRKFVESLEENHSLSMWFIDEIGRLFGIEHDCKKAGLTADQVLVERLQRSKPIMDRIKEKFERFARSNYKGLGALTKKALKYIKTDYAFMFSVIESCNMNKLSPGCYIKELVSRLTAKPVCTAEKVALLPCFMQK